MSVQKVDWKVKLDIELTCLHFGQRVRMQRDYYWIKKSTPVNQEQAHTGHVGYK